MTARDELQTHALGLGKMTAREELSTQSLGFDAREELAAVLAEHEARWTTHGMDRTYEVIHCVDHRCPWLLRQKALMTDDYCYEQHRLHVVDALLASPALAAIKAEVWEQGFMYAAEQDHPAWPRTRRFINPHDANQTDTEETP